MSQNVKVDRSLLFNADANDQPNIFGYPDEDKLCFVDNFVGKALDTTNDYTSFIDTDSVVALNKSAAAGPHVSITTQATDTKVGSIAGNLVWYPAKNPVMEVKFQVDVITNVAINVGFTDAATEASGLLPFLISGTTITDTATDGAMFVFDTAQTTDYFYCVNTKAGTQGGTLLAASYVPVANTYVLFRVAIDSAGGARFYWNGDQCFYTPDAVTTTVPFCPYIGIRNRTASAHIGRLAQLRVWCDR